jgi:hypothetical protein
MKINNTKLGEYQIDNTIKLGEYQIDDTIKLDYQFDNYNPCENCPNWKPNQTTNCL